MPDTETYRMMLYDNDDKIIYDRLLTFSELRRIAPEVAARAEDVGDNGFPIAGEQPVAKCINCGFGRSVIAELLDLLEEVMSYDKGMHEDEWIEFCNRVLPTMHRYGRLKSVVEFS